VRTVDTRAKAWNRSLSCSGLKTEPKAVRTTKNDVVGYIPDMIPKWIAAVMHPVPASRQPSPSHSASGLHILIDMWGAQHLSDQSHIEQALRLAIQASRATLLKLLLHRFGDSDGITGVAILAESHVSVHTWPESGYAAFDIFMCGSADPQAAAKVLCEQLQPIHTTVREIRRGTMESAHTHNNVSRQAS
jgi:S-adenosylmethionine decarboxylase